MKFFNRVLIVAATAAALAIAHATTAQATSGITSTPCYAPSCITCATYGPGCSPVKLFGHLVTVHRPARHRLMVEWGQFFVVEFRIPCPYARHRAVLSARKGNTDWAWVFACHRIYKVALS